MGLDALRMSNGGWASDRDADTSGNVRLTPGQPFDIPATEHRGHMEIEVRVCVCVYVGVRVWTMDASGCCATLQAYTISMLGAWRQCVRRIHTYADFMNVCAVQYTHARKMTSAGCVRKRYLCMRVCACV